MIRAWFLPVLAVLWFVPFGVSAKSWVTVEIDSCTGTNSASVQPLVDVELRSSNGNHRTRDASTAANVLVRCRGEEAIHIRVDDHVTGKSLEREVDLKSTPTSLRPRLIALAIAELVVASWVELEIEQGPEVPIATVTSASTTQAEIRSFVRQRTKPKTLRHRVALTASGELTAFTSGLVLRGGQIAVQYRFAPHWATSIHLGAQYGNQNVSAGELQTFALSAMPAASYILIFDHLELEFSAGFRSGTARIRGKSNSTLPTENKTFWAPWGGPVLAFGIHALATDRFRLDAGIECGFPLFGIHARTNTRSEHVITGIWGGFQLGASVLF